MPRFTKRRLVRLDLPDHTAGLLTHTRSLCCIDDSSGDERPKLVFILPSPSSVRVDDAVEHQVHGLYTVRGSGERPLEVDVPSPVLTALPL